MIFWDTSTLFKIIIILTIIQSISTYEQNDYILDFERLSVINFNKQYLNIVKITTFKYNRTQVAFNGTFEAKVAFGFDIDVIAQAYKFASNEYRLFPLRLSFNLCEGLARNEFGLNTIYQHGNFSGCPIKAARYDIANWYPDPKRFPPFIPNGKYMLGLQANYGSVEMATLEAYLSISRPLGKRH